MVLVGGMGVIHHITVMRSEVGCGLAVCGRREGVRIVRKVISSYHMSLHSSVVLH